MMSAFVWSVVAIVLLLVLPLAWFYWDTSRTLAAMPPYRGHEDRSGGDGPEVYLRVAL